MAWQRKLKLPSLKVVQRSTSGKVVYRQVPRGSTSTQAVKNPDEPEQWTPTVEGHRDHEGAHEEHCHHELHTVFMDDSTAGIKSEPSLYEITRKAMTEVWKEIRPSLLKATVESSAMHPDQLCMLCNASAFYRCLQSAPWAYYCSECFKDAHSRINLFHTGDVWEVQYCVHD